MSKYTTQVRYICEYLAGRTESGDYTEVAQIIEEAKDKIFEDYPIFDEEYRGVLNAKILKHYYTREIGLETVGLWKLKLNTKMEEIMPYYNQLYKSELLKFNPLYDVDVKSERLGMASEERNLDEDNEVSKTETRVKNEASNGTESESLSGDTAIEKDGVSVDNRSESASVTSHRSTENESAGQNENVSSGSGRVVGSTEKGEKNLYSDTPQGGVVGLDEGNYLTNARKVDGNESSEQETEQSSSGFGKVSGTEKGEENGEVGEERSEVGQVSVKDKSKEVKSESGKKEKEENRSEVEDGKIGEVGKRSEKGSASSTEEYLEVVQGKRGSVSYAKMLMEFRESFLNIDRMIIRELADLFFGIW